MSDDPTPEKSTTPNPVLRYGVQYQPLTGRIAGGPVRRDQKSGREVFVLQSDVTGFAIGAVALWVLTHEQPYRITDRNGTTYELTCRIVPDEQVEGYVPE